MIWKHYHLVNLTQETKEDGLISLWKDSFAGEAQKTSKFPENELSIGVVYVEQNIISPNQKQSR